MESTKKTEIIIASLRFLSNLDLENLLNAIQNEKRAREKKSDDGRGNKTSTETL